MAEGKWLWQLECSPSAKRCWLSGGKAHWKLRSTQMVKRLEGGELVVSATITESHSTVLVRELSDLIKIKKSNWLWCKQMEWQGNHLAARKA